MTDKFIEERSRARALLAHHLHAAQQHVAEARKIAGAHKLEVDVPQEIDRAIQDAIDVDAHAYQQENPRV